MNTPENQPPPLPSSSSLMPGLFLVFQAFTVLSFFFVNLFYIPKLVQTLNDLQAAVPTLTKIAIQIGQICQSHFFIIVLPIAAIFVLQALCIAPIKRKTPLLEIVFYTLTICITCVLIAVTVTQVVTLNLTVNTLIEALK